MSRTAERRRARRLASLGRIMPVIWIAFLVGSLTQGLAEHGSSTHFRPRPDNQPLAEVFSAGTFYNSVGINTHVIDANTAYGNWSRVLAALRELGVRHVRDGLYGNPSSVWLDSYFQGRVEQAASQGIRFDFIMGQPGWDGGTVDQLVAVLNGPLRNAVEAVEDPNEWDSLASGDFAPRLSAYDQQVYEAVRANPVLRSIPVIGPSLVGAGAPAKLGDQQAWLDYGNIHPYTGGSTPTPARTAQALQQISSVSGSKPVWATEEGYYDAPNAALGLQPVPPNVAAVYLLRAFLENFKGGIARTYAYELVDDNADPGGSDPQRHFGLMRSDFTPKPAFYALRNLLSLIGDQSPRELIPLEMNVSSGAGDLRQLVLQRSDDTYVLVLWRLASMEDPGTRLPLSVTPARLTLELPTASSVTQTDPITSRISTPLTLTDRQAKTQIGANPLVLQIKTSRNDGQ